MLNQRILLSESSRKSGVVVMTFESGLQQDLHSLLKRIISFKHNSIPPSFLEIEQLQEEISEIQIRHENRVASINTEKHLLSSVYVS